MSKQTVHHATLNNGIILLAECLPGLESVAVAFHTPAGAVHDPSGCSGLATLTGEMMLRGAGDRNGRRIVDDLEGAGVQWSQGVTTSHASFSGGMVAKQLATALPIYADILQHPLLDPKELEKARQVVLQTLAGMEDDPSHRVISALRKLMFPAPWGQSPEGMSADVENLSIADVRSFVNQHVCPSGTIIAAAGCIEWEKLIQQIEDLFGHWSTKQQATIDTQERGTRIQHIPHDSQQTHIALAWSVPPYRDDASYEITAALAILGGGSSSRLFTEVRERRGLCYSVSAGYQTHRDFASAICYAGTTAARAQETLDVMLEEIARLPGSIEKSELDRVKSRVKSGLVMQQESSAARAGGNARQWYHLGHLRTLEEELRRLDDLSIESIERHLATHPMTDLTVVSLGNTPLEVPDAISP